MKLSDTGLEDEIYHSITHRSDSFYIVGIHLTTKNHITYLQFLPVLAFPQISGLFVVPVLTIDSHTQNHNDRVPIITARMHT